MTRTMITAFFLAAAFLTVGCGGSETTAAPEPEIGSSLTEKSEVAIADVPEGVLQAAKAVRPNVAFSEAEKEIRNGVVYYDVGGIDETGAEIELDIMQDGDDWRVVEIQRDIDLSEAPAPVLDALKMSAPDITPARIIESDQNDGVVIYEFFTRAAGGAEAKYEVKYADGKAEFLTEEWAH